ncbi:adenylyl-sulfate kinase [Dechloromonas denitrificans]|uniref:adenylyl-sulfate kinase n=1 Tax=Dechloromonas denitrificans TaxID=281362 RepID=UPI001CFB56F9|nr:adenylyl-sulfate kinase [Dechloromonas denitrificans]UCV06671.1 adenylyl-sulfate kinase [Dechloromonas denitrificans]
MIIWIIGLSGAGKSTLANEVASIVRARQRAVVLLDGDIVRETFGNDLGHSITDRLKNAERICRIGKMLDDQGIDVVCAILSLFPETREWNRRNLKAYREVFIDTPMADLKARDSKGIYKRFETGEARDVAGLDLPFPRPDTAELVIDNAASRSELLKHAELIAAWLVGQQ